MKDNWLIKEQFPERSAELAKELKMKSIVGQLLINRGIDTDEKAEEFFKSSFVDLPSPFLMAGMEAAVARMVKAVEGGETVAVYGDYDADGVTATSLLCDFLRALGVEAIYFAPHRIRDGYGVNDRAVEELGRKGATLIVSTDCGISAVREVKTAKQSGIDFIITDHHLPGDTLPDAVAIVNPKLPDCRYPAKNIAGVGVAFNLALALRARLRENGFFDSREEPNMARYLDLVAIGTVTDRVPLEGVNRIMVKEGLRRMVVSDRPGIEALKRVSRINWPPTSSDIGFRMGPRINAAGRIGEPETAVDLLLCESSKSAAKMARRLDEQNRDRQRLEGEALEEALSMIEDDPANAERACVVLASKDWHPGIIGPLASKLVERYSKPVFTIAIGKYGVGKGSGRTVAGVNLHEALKTCGGALSEYGGHAMAAGITVSNKNIDAFRDAFDEYVRSSAAPEAKPGRTLEIDAKVSVADLSVEMVKQVETLGPFGSGNPTPVFLVEGAVVVSHEIMRDVHLKLAIGRGGGEETIEAMWWNAAGRGGRAPEDEVNMVVTPEVRRWRDREFVALRVEDLEEM
ncbi:MAG: single-stranded-DNA-specific exonuclease RecJ [Candidatus Dadabacteria bacterium]|nr:single-stranded-DNA-specific exonuclease RecJ [Candidatus Dadabacteria bacterium]